jgi:hypothetical protein
MLARSRESRGSDDNSNARRHELICRSSRGYVVALSVIRFRDKKRGSGTAFRSVTEPKRLRYEIASLESELGRNDSFLVEPDVSSG